MIQLICRTTLTFNNLLLIRYKLEFIFQYFEFCFVYFFSNLLSLIDKAKMMTHGNNINENNSLCFMSCQTQKGDSYNHNNNHNNNNNNNNNVSSKSLTFTDNMFEVFKKAGPILPSFLSLEPIPECKIFENKSDKYLKKSIEIGVHKPISISKCPVKIEKEIPKSELNKINLNTKIKDRTNGFSSKNCDSKSNGSTLKGFSSLMPPPPTLVKMTDTFKSKVVKKRPITCLNNTAISQNPSCVVVNNVVKQKRFSCSDCDLGVTFKSKFDLQHHQSGKNLFGI